MTDIESAIQTFQKAIKAASGANVEMGVTRDRLKKVIYNGYDISSQIKYVTQYSIKSNTFKIEYHKSHSPKGDGLDFMTKNTQFCVTPERFSNTCKCLIMAQAFIKHHIVLYLQDVKDAILCLDVYVHPYLFIYINGQQVEKIYINDENMDIRGVFYSYKVDYDGFIIK